MPFYTQQENERIVKEARERVSKKEQSEIGVLFTYHRTCDVARKNLSSFSESNPKAKVVPICSMGKRLPVGFSLLDNAFWNQLTGLDPKMCWRNTDATYYEYYRRRNLNCKRWLLVEWDIFCNGDLEKFFGDFWDKPLVSTKIAGSGWCWFREAHAMPPEAQKFASGCAPLAGTLVSDECMEKIVLGSWWAENTVFCELRIATLAKMAGFELSQHRFHGVVCKTKPTIEGPGLWHPVKT